MSYRPEDYFYFFPQQPLIMHNPAKKQTKNKIFDQKKDVATHRIKYYPIKKNAQTIQK